MQSRSCEIGSWYHYNALKFGRYIGRTAADVTVKCQCDRTVLNTNIPWFGDFRRSYSNMSYQILKRGPVGRLIGLTYLCTYQKETIYTYVYSKNIGPNEGCMFLWSGWSLAQAMACRLISLRLWPKYWYFFNLKPRKQTSLTKQSHY